MKAPEIDPIAYHGLMGRMSKELDNYTEAHEVGVFMSLLTAFSAAIGPGVTLDTAGSTNPLALWTGLVGISGSGRKGTATKLAMRVVNAGLAEWGPGYTIYGMSKTGLGFLQEIDKRRDITSNKHAPVLFIETEMDNITNRVQKDDSLSTAFRNMWDGDPASYKSGKVDIQIPNPHLGIITHAQPKNVARVRGSKGASGGTWNRFFFVWVERSKRLPVFGSRNATMLASIIQRMGVEFRNAVMYARQVERLHVSDAVAAVFEKKHRVQCENLTAGSEELSELAERAMAYMLRLASLFALTERRDYVMVKDFDAALALAIYYVETVKYVFYRGNSDATGFTILERNVLRILEEFGPLTRTKLWGRLSRNYDKPAVIGALRGVEELIAIYMIPKKPGDGPGQPGVMVALKEQVPDDPTLVRLTVEDLEAMMPGNKGGPATSSPTPEDHPNYRVRDDVPVVVETVREERMPPEAPQKPVQRLALPAAPETPKRAARPPKPRQKPVQPPVKPPEEVKRPEATAEPRARAGQNGQKPKVSKPARKAPAVSNVPSWLQ